MRPDPILVLSSWSSGSSAVTGFLGAAGAYLCPPYVIANDEKTPNTFESEEFRGMLNATIDEETLTAKVDLQIFESGFRRWYLRQLVVAEEAGFERIALKHPTSAMVLDQIRAVCSPQFVVVTRPFEAIERTRARRNWLYAYGRQGAETIYNHIYSYLHEHELPYAAISYSTFLNSPVERMRLLDYLDFDISHAEAEAAFITATTR